MSDGAPGERLARIEARLRASLQPQLLRLYDDSALHAVHEGAKSGGGHYRIHQVSAGFEG